uniref:Uncharacterized protein n=1 Tax=Chromera velia CCMP2878 TaxID=1169474 RepID=A0A0K6S5W7_9ALVE|eukprot:Cvel_2749.t2-p1 / transcript=Cvel_2749.t2 / gene=Cvel_2749 / organism=Chromera_velia_CCMP2878 / gene_product=hypothetical protein / transcript_product=hypothetical protein / location=Cvel_scaffold110:76069-78511(+) / protein_length=234 / sequence_SO=supercontig / SO=protein_coding / is_pseudo=false
MGAAGGKEDLRWVWRKKFLVADTGCSRHLIGGDLEDSIVSRRPHEFRYEEASGVEMVCAEEVEAVPVLEGVDGDPIEREEDALCMQEVEKEKEKEGVHMAPEDKKEKEDEKEALRERLGELKEQLAQVIREKEKRRRPLPRVVPIDAEIQKKIIDHVNPRKGHIDAIAEEVAGGSHEGGIRSDLKRFLEEKVFAWGVRLLWGRKAMALRCRWVLTLKKKGRERVAKARLVVKGF